MVSWVGIVGKMDNLIQAIICFGIAGIVSCVQQSVLELDDSFLEKKGENAWLVMFYAPWCGHCRRLEPVWSEVDRYLKDTNSEIHAAKLDATSFSSVASHFDIRGYPTIKFIQGDRVLTYKGDRLRDNIVEFANRASGPVIRWLSSVGKLQGVRSELSDGVFFLYLGPKDDANDLFKAYEDAATIYRVYSYFFAAASSVLTEDIEKKQDPTILVFKDKTYYEYTAPPGGFSKESVEEFINNERLVAFPKMTGSGLNDLAGLKKKIVMFVIEDKPEHRTADRVKQLGLLLATKYREKYHNHFQFIWMEDPEAGNSITMSRPATPYMIVWEMETNLYYLPEAGFSVDKLSVDDMHKFLEDILLMEVMALDNTSKGFFYDITVVVYSIYNESVWLAAVVFGVPSLVISIICYALCCMETVDEELYDEMEPNEYAADGNIADEDRYQKLPSKDDIHKKSE